MRRILEVGPGLSPMHHRDQKKFQLEEDESYIAVERDGAAKEMKDSLLKKEYWNEIRKEYSDRALTIKGDREHLPVQDNTQDEVVMLGTFGDEKTLAEVDRVLKSGGIVRIGTIKSNLGNVLGTLHFLIEKGYEKDEQETKEYEYGDVVEAGFNQRLNSGEITQEEHVAGIERSKNVKRPYVVITYRKP